MSVQSSRSETPLASTSGGHGIRFDPKRDSYSCTKKGCNFVGATKAAAQEHVSGPAPTVVAPHGAQLFVLKSCTYLGGHGVPWMPGELAVLIFGAVGLSIEAAGSAQLFEYPDIEEIELSGRGRLTKNLGLFGGGFGFRAAAEGMLAAAAINSLTTKTWMETFVRIQGASFEMFFHDAELTPADLRIALSPVLPQLGGNRSTPTGTPDVADKLARLVEMFQQGLLTDSEFSTAKAQVLGSQVD